MARSARTQQTRRSSGGGFLFGVFFGIIVGLAVALGVAFYLNKTPLPFSTKGKPAAGKDAAADPAKPPAIAGLPDSGATVPRDGDKPRFDFYKILPGGEEPVSDKELKERQKVAKSQPEASKDVYYIQVGSFQNPADADTQKARLAILGLESSVEPTDLPDKGTWYRVRLGPYNRIDEINRIRQTLAQSGIDASLVKLKDPSTAKPQ
jgi:cell division protein FtsN